MDCPTAMRSVWLLSLVAASQRAPCNFGSEPGCMFPCRCADPGEVCDQDSGQCVSGCRRSPPKDVQGLDAGWTGPGCAMGNVAYGKNATQSASVAEPKYQPENAVDGDLGPDLFTGHCAFPGIRDGPHAWWMVDLAAQHLVYNITIFNSDQHGHVGLQEFALYVTNETHPNASDALCSNRSEVVARGEHASLQCREPLVGRYVLLRREGGPLPWFMQICEVVVVGHPYNDCDPTCSGVCTKQYGCVNCPPGRDPNTLCQECGHGFFGRHCSEECGQCLYGQPNCTKEDGRCPGGCQQWFTTAHCNVSIPEADFKDNSSLTVTGTTSSSVTVSWTPACGIQPAPAGRSHYFYLVQYKEAGGDGPWLDQPDEFPHDAQTSTYQVEVPSLLYDTVYEFRVQPFRTHRGLNSSGQPASLTNIKTSCTQPAEFTELNITTYYAEEDGGSVEMIKVSWKRPSVSGCRSGTGRTLISYRGVNDSSWEKEVVAHSPEHILQPPFAGTFMIRLSVYNKEHLYSTKTDVVTVAAKDTPSSIIWMLIMTTLLITAVCVIAAMLFRSWRGKQYATTPRVEPVVQDEDIDEPGQTIIERQVDEIELTEESMEMDEVVYENMDVVAERIPLKDLEEYFKEKTKSDTLCKDYLALPLGLQARCEAALEVKNKIKNRYTNILAYDHTRVVLACARSEQSDYINANYIKGYGDREKEYIATQGPKPDTMEDFWRMIWQSQCKKIVMLTKCVESGKRKSERYWPEKQRGTSLIFGDIEVAVEGSDVYAHYIHRLIKLSSEGQSRVVHHYQCTTWPDQRQPDKPCALLSFIRNVRQLDAYPQGPLVVHCSAGVGRTGTYIGLDYLLNQIEAEGVVDIRGCVNLLRTQRTTMVQTFMQYVFMYEVLVDLARTGNTGLSSSEFQSAYDKGAKATQEGEFKILVASKPENNLEEMEGQLTENQPKNRDSRILPNDHFRPKLVPRPNAKGTYINAVLVESFRAQDAVVVTTMPLPNTASDFWRLIYDHNCRGIVMLNELDEDDKSCVAYWPPVKEETETYGPISVTTRDIAADPLAPFTTRDLEVMLDCEQTEENKPAMVRQFELSGWPKDQPRPDKLSDLLDLIDAVKKWQQKCSGGKIAIHCSDGASRCGIFCAASLMIEKLDTDQEVDVFLACRHVISSRPEFITDLGQYRLLHDLAREYLARYEVYANFN